MRKEIIEHTEGKKREKLFNFIRRKVSSEFDAEDILQDVFYRLFSTDGFDTIEAIGSWLYTVADNLIIDWYRKKKPVSFDAINETVQSSNNDDDERLKMEDLITSDSDTPEDLYIRSSFWPLLSESLDELPDEQKEVFVLHELEGKSFKEISALTGVPVNTLLSRKRYAILFLRARLSDIYNDLVLD